VKRIMVVFGTRPEAIKLAPLIRALDGSPSFEPLVVVTAQHRVMLDQALSLFGITPDHDLDILRPGHTLAEVTERALHGVSRLLESVRVDAVVVQGDTATTFAGSLAAFYGGVPVVHLEAGLRSYDFAAPFPEEMMRRLTSQLAALHLAPTQTAKHNLLAEHVSAERILVTGNTVVDTLLHVRALGADYGDPGLEDLDEDPRRVLLVTAHRRESWDDGLAEIAAAIAALAAGEPGLRVVFPLHRNPRVRARLLPALGRLPNVSLLEPLPYGSFVRLLGRADLVLTDSGGIQEEAPTLGKPVLVARQVTERPEGVAAGAVRVVGTDARKIVSEVRHLLHDQEAYAAMAVPVDVYGDGRAAERAVAALAHFFGLGPAPKDFAATRAAGPLRRVAAAS
jgi:UDP-N-acetylglucosamine 2-epimerase (non-hydrolysing)